MTTIRTRPYPDGGAAVTGRAATMPRIIGPGRPGQASRTRLRLAVAGAAADRAPHGEPTLGPARPGRPGPAAVHPPPSIHLSRLEHDHAH